MKKVALKNLKDPSKIETADVLTYGKLTFVRAETAKVFVIKRGNNIVAVVRDYTDEVLERFQREHFSMCRSIYKTFSEYCAKVNWSVEELP